MHARCTESRNEGKAMVEQGRRVTSLAAREGRRDGGPLSSLRKVDGLSAVGTPTGGDGVDGKLRGCPEKSNIQYRIM
jgi:hypothetical protein